MRALAFASLARVQSIEEARELFELCAALAQFDPYPASAVNAARRVLGQNNVLLDLFGGGGTIAFEAARLGGKAVSIELNPLAVFVQRTLLNYSQKVDNLAELVRGYGFELLKQLWSGTRSLFPNRERDGETIAYFWVRGAACPNADCGATIPAKQLVPLKSRNGASIYAVLEPMHTSKSFRVLLRNSDSLPVDAVVNRILDCPLCGHALQTVKDGQNEMPLALLPVARCAVSPRGKSYIPYKGDELGFDALIDQELSHLGDALPVTELPGWSGIANPTVYGVKKHSDLFSPRQLLVLLRVMGGIRTLYGQISKVHGPDVGKSVVSCLSGLIDQLVDWNSSFTVWLPTNEQVGRSLAGPGLPMQWGFAEIDPFAHGPANLWDKLDRIVQACEAIPKFHTEPLVQRCSATGIPVADASVDAIVTDPPYADNLYYSILSECIYAWKRLCLRDIFPDEFALTSVPTEEEIVASARRRGNSHQAMVFYRDALRAALSEGYRVLKPHGVLSLIFTHSTLDGWIAVFSAIVGAGFKIVTCWPFCIERKARPRGLARGAVHASCVIVAVKAPEPIAHGEEDNLAGRIASLRALLSRDGWSSAEIGLAVFVQRVAWFLRTANSGGSAFEMVSATVVECYRQTRDAIPEFTLKERSIL